MCVSQACDLLMLLWLADWAISVVTSVNTLQPVGTSVNTNLDMGSSKHGRAKKGAACTLQPQSLTRKHVVHGGMLSLCSEK